MMEKQILLPAAARRELVVTFKSSRCELGRALTYTVNSKRAKVLRAAALQRGGLIYTNEQAPQGYCPNVETIHDHRQGIMYQSFGGRVELQVNRATNAATIVIDGATVATFNDMTLSTWGNVLYSLQQIYNQLNA
ncbi:MAG: hypothetical protein RR221_07540 [Alistipes sp.]